MNTLGAAAEHAAAQHLQQAGLRLITRNWSCRYGEIDLIMQHGAVLVFVEVRSRANHQFGGAAASISAAKQAKLVRAAECYLQTLRQVPACRFDTVCFDGGQLTWLQNCIEL
ncbi:YraN family protein [Chitinibacteraceae bacterium HSL-7]